MAGQELRRRGALHLNALQEMPAPDEYMAGAQLADVDRRPAAVRRTMAFEVDLRLPQGRTRRTRSTTSTWLQPGDRRELSVRQPRAAALSAMRDHVDDSAQHAIGLSRAADASPSE